MKKEKKTAEQMAQEKTGTNLLNYIIAKTFTRHAGMSEEEFLKAIGFENKGKTESEALRIAFMNLLVETTSQLIQARQSFKIATALLKDGLGVNENKENEKVGE